jgi:ATP synthase protein I
MQNKALVIGMDSRIRVRPIDNLIKMQLITLAITVLIVLWWQGINASLACFYGGGIAVVNTLLQRWHLISTAKEAKSDAGKNLGRAYRCVAERWLVTIVMFAIGFWVFIPDEMILAGFIEMQAVVLFGNYNRA